MADDKNGGIMAVIIMLVLVFGGAYLMGFGFQGYLAFLPVRLIVTAAGLWGMIWWWSFEDTWPVIVPMALGTLVPGIQQTFANGPEWARDVPFWASGTVLHIALLILFVLCGWFTWNRRRYG